MTKYEKNDIIYYIRNYQILTGYIMIKKKNKYSIIKRINLNIGFSSYKLIQAFWKKVSIWIPKNKERLWRVVGKKQILCIK